MKSESKKEWKPLAVHAYVVAHWKRPGLIVPYLIDQSHTVHQGVDYEFPLGEAPMNDLYRAGSPLLSNYRVFRAHQDVCRRFLSTHDDYALIFEDDAVPNCPEWVEIVNEAAFTMGTLDVLSLYGRHFDYSRFAVDYRIDNSKREVLRLNDPKASENTRGGRHHVYGALAYLVNRIGAEKIRSQRWEGIPLDVQFWDRTDFAFIHPSPFNHDRRQGSLLYPGSCLPEPEPGSRD